MLTNKGRALTRGPVISVQRPIAKPPHFSPGRLFFILIRLVG